LIDHRDVRIAEQNLLLQGSDSVSDPIPRRLSPIFVYGRVYIALVFKDPGLFGQSHKLNCRNGVFQNNAGALHTAASIHRLALDHHCLGSGWERSQRPHIDDHAEWEMHPSQNPRTLFVPCLEFSFRQVAAEGELISQVGLVFFVHCTYPFLAPDHVNGVGLARFGPSIRILKRHPTVSSLLPSQFQN
jgi:hypothetical protein